MAGVRVLPTRWPNGRHRFRPGTASASTLVLDRAGSYAAAPRLSLSWQGRKDVGWLDDNGRQAQWQRPYGPSTPHG